MNAYETIIKTLQDLAGDTREGVTFSLAETEDSAHGDYATNIAFPLSKKHGVSPKDYAESIRAELENSLASVVQKVEVAGPGFINFFLKDEAIRHENEKGDVQIVTKYTGKNVLVEHSSPNLFKPFSVGHLMNNIIGEFITRAMSTSGAHVKTMSFPSDVSLGIAKALMMVERDISEEKIALNYFSNESEDTVIQYLGDTYVRGVKECEENEVSLEEAKKVLDKMYHLKDDDFYTLVAKTREINEKYFKKTLHAIGSDIDGFVYEGQAGKEGERIVRENIGEGKVFTESEGAVVYIPNESRKDLHTAVFINSQGYPTYEAKDIGLMEIKFKPLLSAIGIDNFFPEYSFFVTDIEQMSHFKIVLDAASKLGDEWKERVEKSHHVPHGRMLFKGAKMSSRLGGVPLALDVISSVEEEVRERAGEKIVHLGNKEKEKLTREIALSALRIAVLRSKPGININFDPETSLSFEGDSGPYLLYTHARCSSLLEKGNKGNNDTPKWSDIPVTTLERKLIHFENELTHACNELAPQKLTTYLFSIAQLFNSYYASTQIIVEGDEVGNAHRLMIVKRTKAVLKKGLYVLGIEAPERM